MAKIINWIQLAKRIEADKNSDKDGKTLYKSMTNAVYGKTMEKLKSRINLKLVNNKKDCLKWTSKASYMSHKTFGNDLVTIPKSKVKLTLYKPAYIWMCILELSTVLMFESHCDYIKNIYGNNSRLLLFTDTERFLYKIKTEDVCKDFSKDKKCLILVIIQLNQDIMIIQTNSGW